MNSFLGFAAVASLWATSAFANESASRLYALDGEILIYPPAQSGLPLETVLAPRGAATERDLLLRVETLTSASDDMSAFTSSPLVMQASSLVLGEKGTMPLEVGNLTLVHDASGWTFYGDGGELKGRPVFSIAPSSLAVSRVADGTVSISGEIVLHEALEAELGLPSSGTLPPSRVVGAVALLASTSASSPTIPAPLVSSTLTPAIGTSALTVPGPDVIVSTVGSSTTSGLVKNGMVGTVNGFSVQTVSCNIGTANAIWIRCTTGASTCNQHPVIGSQFYRFMTVNGSTRFEQIGMSWLKHGFCAADAPSCGSPYTPNASCDWLGLFATDTYGAGLNGTQSNLGPRSEVQPWTGVFPYPYVLNWNLSGDAVYKRAQVQTNDLDPALNAGAQYLGEVVYICTDEPDGNRYNNYSNRAMTVSGSAGNFALAFTGSTNAQESAVQRWPTLDPGVTIANVDPVGDGRIVVGAKATNLGGGVWHYEYAVFNMNNDTAVGSISVPADASVQVTNVGFHDVPYHSGEPYDGTDWPAVQAGGNLTWSTTPFATNVNANALRWSTTYNFRFDANVAPVTGSMTLGMFKSGGTEVATGIPVPGSNGFSFCFGDGTGTACPCGNNSTVGANEGCLSSLGQGGKLTYGGTSSLAGDTVVLSGAQMPNGPCLYFQGTTQLGGGLGVSFGDGLRCVGGTVIRLAIKTNAGGASSYPGGGDPSVSVKGGVAAPGPMNYQIWYRDSAVFCNASTFNLTNAYQVNWVP